MATDWSSVEQAMIAAAEEEIPDWAAVSARASAAVMALSTVAQQIVASADMPDDEKEQLMSEYQQSLMNTITAGTSIAEAAAQNAVSAAVSALVGAVPALAVFV